MSFLDDRLNLAGKVAVIVGGGGGLGRASAVDLGRAGVRLCLAERNEDLLREATTQLEAEGVEVLGRVLDARDPEALAAFYAAVDEAHGRVDVVVNVVGGTFRQEFVDSSPKGWDAIIRTNFTWLLHSTHLALERMRPAGSGSIINLTSIEGHRAAPGFAVYAGMKAAVMNFTKTLAVELAPIGIRVNTIAPDLIPTEGMVGIGSTAERLLDPEIGPLSSRIAIPAARPGTYADFGGCVLFLASDLSVYVTGTSLHPDGGALASSGWFNWPGGYDNVPPARVVHDLLADAPAPTD